ncbi:glutamate receptor ionotropic, kainate 2-like [Trichoplusia ni]|uniref:Glutamate receptor ionotropic, kainate 2-like n=1 Tax=Trichoplusia ni TaxID=7111 RepID=A0A7E5VZA2_TRINI|nr:glutamate receptor ionotropic, kainate 2-like [Trichoplusia ni]
MCWYLLILLFGIQTCSSQIHYTETTEISYQIAGIFERDAFTRLSAFNDSLNHVHLGEVRIKPVTVQPLRTDSYSVWRELCSSNAINPVAIFGPQNAISDGAVRDQCAKMNIPHIQATWQPIDPDLELNEEPETNDGGEEEAEVTFKKISINFYPDSEEMALAYGKLLKYYKWTDFAALYEDNFGLLRVQKILAEVSLKSQVLVYKLDENGDNRQIFKALSDSQISRFLVDCHSDRILQYLNDAANSNLINEYQHYILVSMDASRVAEKLVKLPSNVTWLSLTEYDKILDERHYLATRVGNWNTTEQLSSVIEFPLEALIMDDVANHLVEALGEEELKNSGQPPNFSCTDEEPWDQGANFQNRILKTQTYGITGNIEFDERGRRINYVLYVNEIHVRFRKTIGIWESANSSAIIATALQTNSIGKQQSSKNFIVISRKAKPYFYPKEKCEGDDCELDEDEDPDAEYEGFSVDLVKNIFKILREEKFNYTYKFVYYDDMEYGKLDPITKKWNGLIGHLLDKKADLAVCDLTITEERKKVVDFSVPFMTLGISILFTQDRKVKPGMFSFLNPYTFEVWMYTATAYCVVSIVLFVCARISPADWENPEPCEKDPEELENIWTFKNCIWLTTGSIMTQGCDILPKAIGTRWVCGMWWFFAVIVCQTYIAQLSASMTSALETEPINSVDDLAKQTKILYGALGGGSTLEFFKSSKDKTYRHMYETMAANPVVLVKSNDEGEKRVLKSKNKYAFFMESCTIEYKLKRNCLLKKVGGELDSKDYGIAMPANSPFRTDINRAILKLKESTKLDKIKKKWWHNKYGAKKCEEATDESDIEGDLEMENLIGAFVVLVVGLVFCLFMTAIEFMNEVRNIVVREQVTHKEVFIKELKASLNFFQLQKPVLRNPSRAPSIASSGSDHRREKQASAIENFLELEKEMQ